MRRFCAFLVMLIFVANSALAGQDVVERNGTLIIKQTVVGKIKESARHLFNTKEFSGTPLEFSINKLAVSSVERKFPLASKPRKAENSQGLEQVDLSLIFVFEFTNDVSEELAAQILFSSGLFEYVEALSVPQLTYAVDDPQFGDQYHLDLLQALDAWDIETGDSTVVIGITDTGTKFDHPEFAGTYAYNYNDPIDGIDNDGDGYVDNFQGWDVGEGDNDPTYNANDHGVKVQGCAVMATNNGSQGAGIAFGARILPVKIDNQNGYLTGAYDAIIYAADHGADIINCSWGGAGSYSQYYQDLIDYAVINKGAVVVASAGNDNNSNYFYPASYDRVISVAGTDQGDVHWAYNSGLGSNYNDLVDVSAPAKYIYATKPNGTTGMIGVGTSFASPIVAGVAALVKSKYPTADPQKVAAIIKSTTDNIDGIAGNESYAGLMGTGRVNAFKALSAVNNPYLNFYSYASDDGFDQNNGPGDTVSLNVKLVNWLETATNVSAILRSFDNNSTVLDSISFVLSIGTDSMAMCGVPFKFIVGSGVGINTVARFELYMTDGVHEWKDYFGVSCNKDYVDITANKLNLSFNNYGRIGYTYSGAGLGVKYNNGSSLISEMGVMIGVSSSQVSSYADYELLNFSPVTVAAGNLDADFKVKGYIDDMWSMNPIGATIDQVAYAWSDEQNEDYVIYEYTIKNPTANTLNDFYLGLYGDWNIGSSSHNKADFVSSRNLGYVYEEGGVYGGIKALRSNKVNYYAFDKDTPGEIDLSDDFDDAEEYTTLSSGKVNTTAQGNVAHVISHGPFAIASGDSVVVAFAIVAGDDLNDLKTSAQYAELKYDQMRGIDIQVTELNNVTCSGTSDGSIALNINAGFEPYTVEWVHDPTLSAESLNGLAGGFYTVQVTDNYGISEMMNLNLSEPDSLSVEVISVYDVNCFGQKSGTVDLFTSGGGSQYTYSWSDPSIPSVPNPLLRAGTHTVTVQDQNGCSDTKSFEIVEPDALEASMTWILDDTSNTCAGEASVYVSGGVGPYNYDWNNTGAYEDQDITGLCGGEHVVVITDANGCTLNKTFAVDAPTSQVSVENVGTSIKELVIYPNPAKEYLIAEFKAEANESFEITVVNLNGRVVQKVYADQISTAEYKVLLNAARMTPGNYFIRFSSSNGISTHQFEVQH